jgi:biotin carboxylase
MIRIRFFWKNSLPSVLIIGTYRQTLTVIRSAARSGVRVILGMQGDVEACNYSRYVDETWHHPEITLDRDQFVIELNRFLQKRPDITAIFPVGEGELQLFADQCANIPPGVQLLMCDAETVRICLFKPAMFSIVDELDIPLARHATVSDSRSLFSASDSIGYPCVVKPTGSSIRLSNKKALVFESAADIRENMPPWPVGAASLIVQRHVSGSRHNIYFFSIDGHIHVLAEVKILRTNSADGTGLAVSGITVQPDLVLVEFCQKIAAHLKYQGAGCAQFLVDDTSDKISFLELNPRLGANCAIVYRAGFDLPMMVIGMHLKKQGHELYTESRCKEGVQYAWITGDLIGLKNAIIAAQMDVRGALSWLLTIIRSMFTSPVHITWDWRDPLPTIVTIGRLFGSFLLRLTPRRSNSNRSPQTDADERRVV